MQKMIDETDNVYGHLVVKHYAGGNMNGSAMWLCQCECGKTIVVAGFHLRSGNNKSCGCLKNVSGGIMGIVNREKMKHYQQQVREAEAELLEGNWFSLNAIEEEK